MPSPGVLKLKLARKNVTAFCSCCLRHVLNSDFKYPNLISVWCANCIWDLWCTLIPLQQWCDVSFLCLLWLDSILFCLLLSEASCTSQIETARAVVSEMGEGQAHHSGINDWAKIEYKNSERDVNTIVKKHGTSLKVPISEMEVLGNTIPWISPKSWLEYIFNSGLVYMLSGLRADETHLVGQTWKEFWKNMRCCILHTVCSKTRTLTLLQP